MQEKLEKYLCVNALYSLHIFHKNKPSKGISFNFEHIRTHLNSMNESSTVSQGQLQRKLIFAT